MTLEEKRQLAIQSLKEKMINKMKKIKSSDDTIENILYNISDEAEKNLLRIFDYCHRQFEYQCKYFELTNTIFIPNIYCNKNKTFYILNFIDQYRDRKQKIINEFINSFSQIKIKQFSLKQYRRILKWFSDDLLFIIDKYKVNFSKDNRRHIKCEYCGKKFFTCNNNDHYCSEECAKNIKNKRQKASKIQHYYDGYYMDIHHFVRSGWEHNIARILQWLELDYDYECHVFTLSNGLTYIPDFYVYTDDTYYEIKGEMRTNTLTKYNMFREEYPDKKFIIIDSKIYKALLEQFPNINFDLHMPIIKSHLNNITKYRHNNINYEQWELNYEFYTNRRYIFNNIELISTKNIENNNSLYLLTIDDLDKIPNDKLLDKYQVMQLLNLTQTKLKNLISVGLINYYLINENLYFTKAFILKFQKLTNTNRQIQITTIQNQLQIKYKLQNNKTEIIIDDTINEFERNIMYILRFLNIEFTYESEALEYSCDKYIISKIYIPQENNYYFITPAYTQNYRNQLNELKLWNKANINIVIIDQNTYDLLISIFSKKIPQLIIPKYMSIAINNQNNEITLINNSSYHYCFACGKLLTNKRKKYCSKECWTKARHKYIQQQCLNCNQKFSILKMDQSYIYFCSEQCSIEYEQKHLHDNTISSGECKYCSKHFVYLNKNKKHLFCSSTCAKQYQIEKHQKTFICKECGKTFTNQNHRVFCSTSCNAKWNYKHNRAINTVVDETIKIFPTSAYYMDIHHYVRNNQEHNIARILQINQINYEYLPKQFKLSTGEILIASFLTTIDNIYYIIANTISTEKLKKQIALAINEYGIDNFCLIDKQIYTDLIQQYLLKSLITQHIAINNFNNQLLDKLRNITVYDCNKINYEFWELDYKFYTNKRYLNENNNIAEEHLKNYICIDDITDINKNNIKQSLHINKIRFSIINNKMYLFKPDLEILKITINQLSKRKYLKLNREYKYTRQCAYCEKIFKTNVANKKYCSSTCANKVHENNRTSKIICSHCGKEYIIKGRKAINNKHICRDCYYKLLNTPEIKKTS